MPTAESPVARRPRIGNLPGEVDTFIGRRGELEDIRELFGSFPLVTLVGLGGVGKTRLAIRAASRLSRVYGDRTWFVELGDLHDPALLIPTLAEAVGVLEPAVTLQSVVAHLSKQPALLVLDNCEHMLDEVAAAVKALLRACPQLRVLATSRERLGIRGEGFLDVEPLTFPKLETDSSPEALLRFDAVNLFTERARAVMPDFMLTQRNSAHIARICQQLDGVPLALELAAARLRTLSPGELAARLVNRYQMLTGGSRGAPLRHQTMRLCVDWSHEQCTAAEQLLWQRIAVFTGSFELDAVEVICGFGGLVRDDVLNVLSALVDKSIVSLERSEESTQFRLLETIREYGLERLAESGELNDLRRRHRDWYESMTKSVRHDMIGPLQLDWTARLDRELSNVRSAMEYCLAEPGEAVVAHRIAGRLHLYWISRGLLAEGRYWLDRALAADADNPANHDRVVALFSVVALTGIQGDVAAAAEAARECRSAAAAVGDLTTEAYATNAAGMLALFTGELPAAATSLGKAAQDHHVSGDTLPELEALIGVALAYALLGELDRAVEYHARVLNITRPLEESLFRAFSLWVLGIAMWRSGQIAEAAEMLGQSLRLRRRMNDLTGSAWCIQGLAFVAESMLQPERAAVLLGASASLSHDAGTPPATFPDLISASTAAAGRIRQKVGDGAYARAFDRGRGMDLANAVAFALGEPVPERDRTDRKATLLTPREWQVAHLVADGLTNRGIADKLVISPRTAENHVEKILSKLGFTTRTQIATWVPQEEHNS